MIAGFAAAMRDPKCRMIKVHHPDCECQWCTMSLDEECAEPAVASVLDRSGGWRVCEECAVVMHLEGDFRVVWDDGRSGVAS
jgi:hypothetical protein